MSMSLIFRLRHFSNITSLSIISDGISINGYKYLLQCRRQVHDVNPEEATKKKKKTVEIPKIKLIYPDNTVTSVILEEAQKIAKRRNFELIQLPNKFKGEKCIYKLVPKSDCSNLVDDEDIESSDKIKSTFKPTKIFYIQSHIQINDVQVKINQFNRLLKKKHKVKVIFNEMKEEEEIVQTVKNNVKGIVERLQKGKSTLIVFAPKDDSDETKESKE